MRKNVLTAICIDLLLALLVWWGVSLWLSLPILPSPLAVARNLGDVFFRLIAVHVGWSLWRIVAGLFLAVLVGFPLGIGMGYFPRMNRFLAPSWTSPIL